MNDVKDTFIMFPKIFKGKTNYNLTNDAKVLYIYIRDRACLSEKNGWVDESGSPYIYYSREEMAKDLGVSLATAKRAFASLKAAGLVTVGEKSSSRSPKLYVKNLLSEYPKKQVKNKNTAQKIDDVDDWEMEILRSMAAD